MGREATSLSALAGGRFARAKKTVEGGKPHLLSSSDSSSSSLSSDSAASACAPPAAGADAAAFGGGSVLAFLASAPASSVLPRFAVAGCGHGCVWVCCVSVV